MMVRNLATLVMAALLLSACGLFNEWYPEVPPCERGQSGCPEKKAQKPKVRKICADEEDVISLQHPVSRVIVHCYTDESLLAETCARLFEKEGFVRFREIPLKTADYDFLKYGSYPTRRWRENEATPRW